MATENQVVLAQPKKAKVSYSQRAKYALSAIGAWVITTSANAGMFDAEYTKFTEEMTAAKASLIGMFGVAFSLLIMFAIWRYTKSGANRA